jgi:8-oxo-dGTP pyrophosphatase MutT (NUDIX family)
MTSSIPNTRPAATLMLIRNGSGTAPEVLLVNRHRDTAFGSLYAFPGGVVEAEDLELAHRCVGLDEDEAKQRFRWDQASLSYWVAALRETFEETGILLAHQRGRLVAAEQVPHWLRLLRDGLSFTALCDQHDLVLPLYDVHYIAHWVTPIVRPARFDARFFLAVWPAGQGLDLDARELTDSRWCTASAALQQVSQGVLDVPRPTAAQLRWLAEFGTLEEVVDHSRDMHRQGIERILPVVLAEDRVVFPGDADYPD